MRAFALLCFLLAFCGPHGAHSQIRPGASLQIYPAGQIIQIRASVIERTRSEINLYAGVNLARRQDFGRKDDEKGWGPGAGADMIWYLSLEKRNWFIGPKLDVWSLSIDWEETIYPCGDLPCLDPTTRIESNSHIWVLQPTVQMGYRHSPSAHNPAIFLSLALGAEINAFTRGDQVGQGAILLAGLAVRF